MVIENKHFYELYKQQFELMWHQDTYTEHGFKEVTARFETMLEELDPGEEYCVLGASIQLGNKELNRWLVNYHTKRVNKEVKAKLLCTKEAYDLVKKNFTLAGDKEMKLSKARALAPQFSSPFQINLYKDKVMFFLWEELKCFTIESKTLRSSMQSYFDILWNAAKK